METVHRELVCTEAEREENKTNKGSTLQGPRRWDGSGVLRRECGALQHVCWELWEGVWLEPVMCQRFCVQSVHQGEGTSWRPKEAHSLGG